MAQVKVTAELLRTFAQTLRTEKERFESIKKQMDEQLFSGFQWEDPVSHKFKADYEKELHLLERDLLPAMEKYHLHLDEEAAIIESYTEEGSPSLSAFKMAAMTAGVVGVGAAIGGATAAGGVTGSDLFTGAEITGDKLFTGTGITGDKIFESTPASELFGNEVTFNQDAAIERLQTQAKPKPPKEGEGQCAEYVRYALESGGIVVGENENRGSAKNYTDILPKKGFETIPIILSKDEMNPQMDFKKGDIVVFDACVLPTKVPIKNDNGKIIGYEKTLAKKPHIHGHIQMYDGEHWISDYKQNSFWPWNAEYTRDNIPKYTFFRLNKEE